jgi:hypothetical protein
LDDGAALRQIYRLMADDGLIYITTLDRDWQGIASGPRVTRYGDGWHVRNSYTLEKLEAVLMQNGFEAIDRLRYAWLDRRHDDSTEALPIAQRRAHGAAVPGSQVGRLAPVVLEAVSHDLRSRP